LGSAVVGGEIGEDEEGWYQREQDQPGCWLLSESNHGCDYSPPGVFETGASYQCEVRLAPRSDVGIHTFEGVFSHV